MILISFIWAGLFWGHETLIMITQFLYHSTINYNFGSSDWALIILMITLVVWVVSILIFLLSIWVRGVLYITIYQSGCDHKKDWRQAIKRVMTARWRLLLVHNMPFYLLMWLWVYIYGHVLAHWFSSQVVHLAETGSGSLVEVKIVLIKMTSSLLYGIPIGYLGLALIFAEISVLIENADFFDSIKAGFGIATRKLGCCLATMIWPALVIFVTNFVLGSFIFSLSLEIAQGLSSYYQVSFLNSVQYVEFWVTSCLNWPLKSLVMPWIMATALVIMHRFKWSTSGQNNLKTHQA